MMDSYICEISPPSLRGPLTSGPQLLITLGLVTGFFVCYGTSDLESSFAWRIPFIILTCLSFMFAVSSKLWLVPSPRWLTLRGRPSDASAAWDILGVGQAEREKAEIDLATTANGAHGVTTSADSTRDQRSPESTKKHRFFDVFARDVCSRTILAAFLLGMQQLSGIDGVLYVSLI